MGWARTNCRNGCSGGQVFDPASRHLAFTVLVGAAAAVIALAVPACSSNSPQITSAAASGARAGNGSAGDGSDPAPGSSAADGSYPAPGSSAGDAGHPAPGSSGTGTAPAAVSQANGGGKSAACPTQGVGGDNLPPLCAVPAPVSSAVSVTPPATATPTPPPAQAPSTGLSCSVPTVTGVSPDHGAETGGNTVTITGTGFGAGADVLFGGTSATDITPESDTEITAVSPPEQPGHSATVDVTVSCAGGVSPVVAADKFSYSAATPSPSDTPSAGP